MDLPEGLQAFLGRLEDFCPTIPDDLTKYQLREAGDDCDDTRLLRTVSVTTQYFVASVLYDAIQLAKRRRENSSSKRREAGGAREKLVLTAADVCDVLLDEHGLNEKRPMYISHRSDKDDAPA